MKTTAVSHDRSRVLGVARQLINHPLDAEVVYGRLVILTGEVVVLNTSNGRWCLETSLHLMCRAFGSIQIVLPAGLKPELGEWISGRVANLWSRKNIVVVSEEAASWEEATAILSVGSKVRSGLPWTSINSNGWVARVSSGPKDLPGDVEQANPMAAMLAASMGVTEVFKRIFGVPLSAGPMIESTQFSLYDFTSQPTHIGPVLPSCIELPDTVLFGAGAIGNAVALLLSQMNLSGRLHIVDKQLYAPENAETCTQIEIDGWIGNPKAVRLARWLSENSQLAVTGEQAWAADAINTSPMLGSMTVDLVLSGFDDIQARHDVQRLWPSTLVDGGISQLSAGVTQYRVGLDNFSCMKCSFELPKVDLSKHYKRLIGLPLRSDQLDSFVTDEDVAAASTEHKAMLQNARMQGKKFCSVITDASDLLEINAVDGFQPSAPFVASASAALMLSETVKALAFPGAKTAQQFQFGNLLLGPEANAITATAANPDCHCTLQRERHRAHAARRKPA